MLESEIKKLTVAIDANTAALLGGATAAPAAAPAAPVASPADIAAAATAAAVAAAPVVAAVVPVADIDPLAGLGAVAPSPTDEAVVAPVVDVTLKMITEGIVALCKAKGRESAAMLMAEYGAQKVPDLKKVSNKYAEILGKINALIEAK